MLIQTNLNQNIEFLDKELNRNENFDIIRRNYQIGTRSVCLFCVDGFVKDYILEGILFSFGKAVVPDFPNIHVLSENLLPYSEISYETDFANICDQILSGMVCLIVDGFSEAVILDSRLYPARSVEEPETDKVLRGSRDGFVENLIDNTAMIRRRIRDKKLVMRSFTIGNRTKTNVILCYLDGEADLKLITDLAAKLSRAHVKALTMAQESVAEILIKSSFLNPFPKIRYTERPDICAASILEGKVAIITDTSPSVMLLPTSLFDFAQEADDFYFPPVVGTYMRLSRFLIFTLTIFLIPTWFLLVNHPDWIPKWLDFMQITEPSNVPLILQILIMEIAVDGLRLASINTPSMLSGSFSIIGALVLGEFGVKAELFVPEVILFGAFVAMANYTQASFELGYAFKFTRLLILILTALLDIWGYLAGFIILILFVAFNKTAGGKGYLYPLIPFNRKAFIRVFLRPKMEKS